MEPSLSSRVTQVGAAAPTVHLERFTDFDEWAQLISDTTVPVVASSSVRGSFQGALLSRVVDDVAIVRTKSVPQFVRRTARGCRGGSDPMVKVLVQRTGRALIEQDHRRGVIEGGLLTVYDTMVPYTLSQTTEFIADAILIPRDRLPMTTRGIAAVQNNPVSLRHGPGEMLLSYLDSLLRQVDVCSPSVVARCSSVLVELLTASLLESPATAPHSGDAMREIALVWIGRHLGDVDLTPGTVAAATGVSVRYLHRLFEDSGTTVAGYIRCQRLKRIHADLVDPQWSELAIARIGARWGVPDPAHLSRLVRSEYGRTPGDIRHEAHAARESAVTGTR